MIGHLARRAGLVQVVACVAVLAACATPATRPTAGAPTLAFDQEQLVVVTIANPVNAATTAAGSTLRGYHVTGGYRVSTQAQAAVTGLQRDYGVQSVDAWPITVLGVHCVVFATGPTRTADAVIAAMAGDARVESVQPLNAFRTLTTTDPHRGLQHGLDALDLDAAHAVSRGAGVRIAVIDTAVDASHPDLAGRIASQHDLVGERGATATGESHGTAVAGVIAALAGNNTGIAGVAPEARLVALRACWPQSEQANAARCNSFTLARALTAAIEADVDIVNLSLGGPSDPLLRRLVAAAHARGMLVVGAALPGDTTGFPADVDGVVAARVATAASAEASPRSASVPAPGEAILTTRPGGRYAFSSGTSMAAAHVSGVAALLLSANPSLSTDELTAALLAAAQPARLRGVGDRNAEAACLNACVALARIDHAVSCTPAPARVAAR